MAAVCPNGHENADGSKFCNTCGAAIVEATATASPTPVVTAAGPTLSRSEQAARWFPWMVIAGGVIIAVLFIVSAATAVGAYVKAAQIQAAQQAAADADADRATLIPAAVAACGLDASIVGDDGRSVLLDGKGKDAFSGDLTIDDLICVLGALNTPDAVIDHMSHTRSLDGTQTDEWGDFSASWTYHPDNGLDIIIRLAD